MSNADADQFYSDNESRILALDAAVSRACNAHRKDKDTHERRKALREIAEKFDSAFIASCIAFRSIAPHRELAEALAPEPAKVKPAPEPSQDDDYTTSLAYDAPHIKRVMMEMDHEWAMVTLGSDIRIMREPAEPGTMPKFHGIEAFRNIYLNKKINVPVESGYKAVPVAKLWLEWPERRTYIDGVIFEPEHRNRNAYNLWRGYPTVPRKGKWDKLRGHTHDNICAGDEARFKWFMTWLADLVQNPGVKRGSAVAIKGLKGTGKSKLFEWVKKALGNHAIKVSQKKHVVGDFNGHHKGVILMVCEEAFWSGDHAAGNALKDLITSDTMMFEQKGIDAVPISNYVRLAFISNEHWIVPASDEDERRYCVFECSPTRRGDIKFFKDIDEEMKNGGLEAMMYELSTWNPEEHYPGIGWDILRTPPMTEELQEQSEAGRSALDKFFIGFIEDGKLEAREKPDLPEIEIEEGENEIPTKWLREHVNAAMSDAGTVEARRVINNRLLIKKEVQKWLGAEKDTGVTTGNGVSFRYYKCPGRDAIIGRTLKRGIRLDLPAADIRRVVAGLDADPAEKEAILARQGLGRVASR